MRGPVELNVWKGDAMRNTGGATRPLAFAIVGLLVSLPILYILSAGPSHWLWTRGYISGSEGSFQWVFYTPMRWACQSCEPFCQFIEWYSGFFEADQPIFRN